MGVGCGECAPPQKIFFILGSRNAYFGAFSCLSECLLTLLPYCNTSKSRPRVRLPRPTFLGWLWLSQSCWSSWQKGHWALASVTRINTFLFTLAFNWHWHYPLPAPLKLRPNGAIQICYYYYGKYVKNLIVANVQTLRDDDCNSHNFSLDGHEYGGPWPPSGSATGTYVLCLCITLILWLGDGRSCKIVSTITFGLSVQTWRIFGKTYIC